ncbi:hypothetical protein [Desulfoluna spongiiphila]|uniref:hypothetical protein n=1 Tax=Desulfoluna spongiiphila TaxID=419481 RepID=UPI001259FD36|nr:hypothetical protein [Desulfoluna spongiiphila]VVS94305.1 hypothetical protein DBB_38770 [Desulfoluna spongiiphila]
MEDNAKKTVRTRPCSDFTDAVLSNKRGLPHLSEKLADMLKSSEDAKKRKISYSISSLSQTLIKTLSDEAGATQGHLVDLAPFLFGAVLEDAMERRKEALDTLTLLTGQIKSSLKAFSAQAPHLAPYAEHIATMVTELCAMEQDAVASKNHQGVSRENHPLLSAVAPGDTKPPYYKEIEALLSRESRLEALFQAATRDDE